VPVGQLLPVPPGVSLRDAASFPEVACTVWSTVFMMSHLSPGESFLVCSIHGICCISFRDMERIS
jgi:NADPH:quinone reductase-like Zn-dependent oxidoreductase